MSGSAALSPSAPLPQEPLCLDKNSDIRDDLVDVVEEEDFALAVLKTRIVEVPKTLVPRLQELIGQHIVIGFFCGKHQAEVSHI